MKQIFFSFLLVCGLASFSFTQEKINQSRLDPNSNTVLSVGNSNSIAFASFFESFEGVTFPPTGWVNTTVGGVNMWRRITVGTTPLPGWTSGTITAPPTINGFSSGSAMAYVTYDSVAASNDEWLITPQIQNVQANDSLYFWLRKFTTAFADTIDIRISTTTNALASFTINARTLGFGTGGTDTAWVFRRISLGSLVPAGSNIFIGFRQRVEDNWNNGAAFCLDLVNVGPQAIPVELSSFNAIHNQNNVVLTWETKTEKNNQGFEVQRKYLDGEFATIGYVTGRGTTTLAQQYSFVDRNVLSGQYQYRLRQIDFDGSSNYSKVVNLDIVKPATFSLEQNYPNPFNPVTGINYSIPKDGIVTLKVYNVIGQAVATLYSGFQKEGSYSINFDASELTSGIYFYTLNAEGFTSTKKMILTK
ncbi:MAG: hypothetical protein C0425_08180 [Chlorobiaceae bacterium]|nr:hypothetical protein [Chlorobiaceae bacterium]MBA4310299.1 hypothetical protein [Chlorobiaceae bacterium]